MTGMEPAIVGAIATEAGLSTAATTALSGLTSTGVSMVQTRKQQRAQQTAAAHQARQKLETMEKQREINQRNAQKKLKRDLASQRARFGASGLTSSRSADAVLHNLQRQTEQQLADEDWIYRRDVNSIHNELASSSSKPSLLDFAPELIDGFAGLANSLSPSKPKFTTNPRHAGGAARKKLSPLSST